MAQQQRYRVIERIAAGGMAEVYRAESAGLEGFKKLVAIKRVLPHLSEKKQFIGMFLDEARLGAHLSHSNCVQVFDIGQGDNTYFIVMEYVDGADLKQIVEHARSKNQQVPVEVASMICLKICEGLSYAHGVTDHRGKELGIVHRDLSPPNVLLTKYGEVKVVDFGLAKATSQLEQSEPGIIKGKFGYLSPEAALGQPVDRRTDIFAAGIILWEMLAGRRLFLGETDLATVRQVQTAKIPPIRQFNPQVTPELEQVILNALARDPMHRYQTARDFAVDLNTILFKLGRSVSSFDIAKLVVEAAAARDAERARRAKADNTSLISSLIDDAMVEFTSLDTSGSMPEVRATGGAPLRKEDSAAAPLDVGSFEDVQDWAGDLGLGPEKERESVVPEYESGNLAQLEDESPSQSLASVLEGDVPSQVPSEPPPASHAPAHQSEAVSETKKSGGAAAFVAFLVGLVLAAVAAGVYLGGRF